MTLLQTTRPNGLDPYSLLRYAAKLALLWRSRLHRRRLTGTRFIAVTGSAGKTTATSLIAAVLKTQADLTMSDRNVLRWCAKTLAATRPSHGFCVQEFGAYGPDTLDPLIWAFEPDVAVLTNVGWDHRSEFRNLEAVAAEKGKIVAALPASGVAVLNADDERVNAMAARTSARIVRYGLAQDADLRAEDVKSAWPEPLSFRVVHAGSSHEVQTRLHGVHWTTCVLAALATGVAVGVPLVQAAKAVATVEPWPHRLSVIKTPGGPTFLLDDWKAPEWTIPHSVDVLRNAKVGRRVAVIGQVSDSSRKPRRLYPRIAREARSGADLVVLVGRWAHYGLRARASEADESIVAFHTVRQANEFLNTELRPDDLVLIKAGGQHTERLAFARHVRVDCWVDDCTKKSFCELCPKLTSEPHSLASSS